MAWALDSASVPVAATSGTTITIAHTIGSGANRLVVAGGCINATRNVSSATYNGVAMTAVANPASGGHEARLFYILEASLPATGTYNCVITYDGALAAGTPGIGHCASFTGVDQNPAQSTAGTTYGNVSAISDAVSPTTDGCLAVSLLSVADPRTITATGGQGAAIATLDGTTNLTRSRLYAWTGPTPNATVTSSFSLSSASATNAQHVAAFGAQGAVSTAATNKPGSLTAGKLTGSNLTSGKLAA